MSIKIPVSAELNQQDVTKQIQQIEAALNDLGRVAEAAGKVKFTPITKTTVDDARRMRAEFEAILRLGPGLKRALETGGQGGKSFEAIDWGKVWSDPNQRASHAASLLRRLSPGSAELTRDPGRGAGGVGGGGRRPRDRHEDDNPTPGTNRGSWRRAGASAAAGVAGGVASQVGGLAGGVASGALAGGMVGGPVGAAIGGLAGSITSLLGSVGEARDLAISLDTLKRTLGDINVSFEDLQGRTRSLADEFSLTDSEAIGLTRSYATMANADKNLPGLRDEVGVGVGFSRSFGLDPSAGVNFFGQMRGLGITKSADDNKRLALLIGESVAKAGELPRMADVMAGLSRYMESTATRSLAAGDSSAWLSKAAALSGSGLPGMTPGTTSNMIAKVDAAVSQGGITEAGKNFMVGQLQKELGLNPIQANAQLEGGLFATGKSTFGEGSPMAAYYAKSGVRGPEAANSTKSNMEILMGALERQYTGRPDLMLDAMKNQFGLSSAQAAAWQSTGSVKLGGLVGRLGRLGIDPSRVNSTGISQLSQIEADTKLSDAQKDAMVRDAASKNQEDTDGSIARKASIDGGNAMVRLANEGLPMISAIQAGVLRMAGMDGYDPQRAKLKAEHDKRMQSIDAKEGKARDEALLDYQNATPWAKRITGLGLDDNQTQLKERYEAADAELIEARKAENSQYGEAQRNIGATPSASPGTTFGGLPSASSGTTESPSRSSNTPGLTPEILKRAAQSDALHGLPDGTTAGLMMQESSFNSGAVSRKGARGMFQIMPDNVAEFSRRVGRQLDPTNTDDAFYMYDQLMAERDRKYGSDTVKKLRSYHGGYDETAWGSENADYVPAIEKRKRELEAARRDQINVQVHQTGEFVLRDTGGQQLAVADIQTAVGPPRAYGQR